jgi:hypothetical protein
MMAAFNIYLVGNIIERTIMNGGLEMTKKIIGYYHYWISEDGDVYSDSTGTFKKLRQVKDSRGYFQVCLCKNGKMKTFRVHRLVAEYFLNDWNAHLEVDHIDMDKLNNKVSNLRMATRSQNKQNNKGLGVSFRKDANKWQAYIKINDKQKCLGLFLNKEDAIAAREAAVKQYYTYHHLNREANV